MVRASMEALPGRMVIMQGTPAGTVAEISDVTPKMYGARRM